MRIAAVRSAVLVVASLLAAFVATAQPPEGGDPIADLIEDGAPEVPAELVEPPKPVSTRRPQTLDAYLSSLRSKSCPSGTEREEPDSITLKASPVALQGINPGRKSIGGLNFVAGFHLTSDDKRFGGLSGLDFRDHGNLLAVSDTGFFVWLDLAEDGVTPVSARIAAMRDGAGKVFPTKGEGDAEGLALQDGLALVSFEGVHRVLAYDIGECGTRARGASVGWNMENAIVASKISAEGNEGAEALAITHDWRLFSGLETRVGKESILSARPLEVRAKFDLKIGKNAPELVGLDLVESGDEVHAFSLHRSSRALTSNAITIVETVFERDLDHTNLQARVVSGIDERARSTFKTKSSRTLAEMNLLLTIDNYEGIAAKQMPDGHTRLFLVSDDNFSASQRTLLMVFDVK
ncbi:MAG: esterase-like activity of phytase family protein [Hyphomonadaceae bacterium]